MSTIHSDQIPINVHIMSTINLDHSERLTESKILKESQSALKHLKVPQIVSKHLEAYQSVSKSLKESQRVSKPLEASQRVSKHLKARLIEILTYICMYLVVKDFKRILNLVNFKRKSMKIENAEQKIL